MTRFVSLKKFHTKFTMVKRNLELNDLEFLCYSAKACSTCPGLCRLIFQSLYQTSLIPPRWEIDETQPCPQRIFATFLNCSGDEVE